MTPDEDIDGSSLVEFLDERNVVELTALCPKLKDRMALRKVVEEYKQVCMYVPQHLNITLHACI